MREVFCKRFPKVGDEVVSLVWRLGRERVWSRARVVEVAPLTSLLVRLTPNGSELYAVDHGQQVFWWRWGATMRIVKRVE